MSTDISEEAAAPRLVHPSPVPLLSPWAVRFELDLDRALGFAGRNGQFQ